MPEEIPMSAQDQADLSIFHEDTSGYEEDPDRFLKEAKLFVMGSYNCTHDATEEYKGKPDQLQPSDLYIVWFSKTLQNWKALVSTSRPGDGLYFEVTHNGDLLETYVDTYLKIDRQTFAHHNY